MTGLGRTAGMSSWAWILGLQLLLVLPFVGQPIHLDDPIFLDIGRNVLKTPWHAHDFPYCFDGGCVPDMASHSHPPFVGYWIGLLLRLFGEGPRLHITLHLGFLVFPLLFAAGMYRLALRFAGSPPLAAAVAIASPTAVVMSHNLMSDYPSLAFWTLALALYIGGVDDRKPARVWISGIFLALAAFCSYTASMAVGICWLYSWLKRSRMRAAFWAPLLAIIWMAAWLTYSSLYFDRFVLARTAQYFLQTKGSLSAAALGSKLLSFPIMLAGTLALPVPLVRAALGWLNGRAAILWAMISAAVAQIYAADYPLSERFLVVLLLAVGGWMIFGLLLSMWQSCTESPSPELRQDALVLTAWAVVATALVLFVYPYASARYLLPLLPPLVLLAFFRFPTATQTSLRWSAGFGLSTALVMGLGLSAADFEMARVHRDIARYFGEALKGWEKQTRFGGEWGFRHYMLEQGFRQFISTNNDLKGGQLIISPRQAVPYAIPQDAQSMLVPVWHKSWQSSIPIRLMNQESHAGFYSSGWGFLPFAFSRVPVEEVTVQQVSYLVERLPEITLENTAKKASILPRPAPGGGVELVVPVPSRLRIPYDGPWPVRVRFSCVWTPDTNTPECPMRVYYDREGLRVEAALQKEIKAIALGSGDIPLYFELLDSHPGVIVLEMNGTQEPVVAQSAIIKNWLMLPSGGRPRL